MCVIYFQKPSGSIMSVSHEIICIDEEKKNDNAQETNEAYDDDLVKVMLIQTLFNIVFGVFNRPMTIIIEEKSFEDATSNAVVDTSLGVPFQYAVFGGFACGLLLTAPLWMLTRLVQEHRSVPRDLLCLCTVVLCAYMFSIREFLVFVLLGKWLCTNISTAYVYVYLWLYAVLFLFAFRRHLRKGRSKHIMAVNTDVMYTVRQN